MNQHTPNPLKRPALRNPGESLEREIDREINDHLAAWALAGSFAVAYAVMEWGRWLANLGNQPVLYSVLAIVVISAVIWRARKTSQRLKLLRTGLLGERYIGNFLQNHLLRKGYWAVHDIECEDFNIDHALIGPGGVFAIETKTRSKRHSRAKVSYDGDHVLVDGLPPDRDPVIQAKAVATRLQRILLDLAGEKVQVRPVVLFPEWFVEKQPPDAEVWVLNEKAFISFVGHEPERLSPQQVFRLASALGRYVRDSHSQTG